MPARLIRHVLLPSAGSLALLAAYYSGVPALAAVIAPAVNRELGLLEHLQLLALGAAVLTAARAAGRAVPGTAARRVWIAVAVVVACVLLEELDYGRHHALLLAGRPAAWADVPPPALHNRPVGAGREVVYYVKAAANVGLAGWFVVLPLARGGLRRKARRSGRWAIRWRVPVVPSGWYAATVAVFAGVSQLAGAMQEGARAAGASARALDGNVSEFGELVVYYLVALYVREVARGEVRVG